MYVFVLIWYFGLPSFGCLSKLGLVYSSVVGLVYFSIMLIERERERERERESCYWVKGANQRYVQRRMRGAQTPESNDVIKTPERERIPGPLCQEECLFFFYACVISFSC